MDHVPFYKTRMGERFYCRTLPDLVRQLERLNGFREAIAERGTPADRGDLAASTQDLIAGVERVLDTEIVSGSPRTRAAFATLHDCVQAARDALERPVATHGAPCRQKTAED